ncbi:hypothetical protein KMW28_26090 [Flammeovirga yaeyamensis]|uniref:Uncharacterized protein n=1 Tax=Flammeovirga yaeyamensis TaxID=367791 RepID=A0AAX1NE22_9BACT|nr:hypothetical protein [Flammeovirga yaeyamensis]MBB3699228.1 hypothetical protein [Flammeovirga yaeyamensis]NMF35509.1 hypothetical protein [Flammeovirga yaeyamensis]QWG04368.1 hypothetical protein KMW28_26090 [Flammeovirga yaeyamensis]
MYNLITILVLLPTIIFSQNIDGIEIGVQKQNDQYLKMNDLDVQVMPVVSDANNKCYGLMYMPVDKDSKIPKTISSREMHTFEEYLIEKFDIEFDTTINYHDEVLKFSESDGVEYELKSEVINQEIDTFFVVWFTELAKDIEDQIKDVR